ncbi:MAG TPA: DUF2782 domain-containing protein [Usitatibacter sp.]|nr:DUF2782 domain-containing protein [Usitatibacter sp.]HXS53221.1 DUF2782 domain-containing protein [Usitatibacter sp.]
MRCAELPRRSTTAFLAAAAFSLAAASAVAQPTSTERPKPPTVPLEDVPPPPPMITTTPEPEPQVTTRTEGGETIQEYRVNNKLYMMRVTPKHGAAYVLMDQKGDGTFTRLDTPITEGNLRVPQWVLMQF